MSLWSVADSANLEAECFSVTGMTPLDQQQLDACVTLQLPHKTAASVWFPSHSSRTSQYRSRFYNKRAAVQFPHPVFLSLHLRVHTRDPPRPSKRTLTLADSGRSAPGPSFGPLVHLQVPFHGTSHQGLQSLLFVAFQNRKEKRLSDRAVATTPRGRGWGWLLHGDHLSYPSPTLPLSLYVCEQNDEGLAFCFCLSLPHSPLHSATLSLYLSPPRWLCV